MLKAYKYRIYPSKEQKEMLSRHFGCVRYIYNKALDAKIKHYAATKKSLSCFSLITGLLMDEKKSNLWLKEVHSQPLQMSLRNLDNAFNKFFKEKKGFPKFKTKHGKNSFQYPQGVSISCGKIYLPRIGDVKIVQHRFFDGIIKTVTVSKTNTLKYYVSVLVDDGMAMPKKKKPRALSTVGIDVGLRSFITMSDGSKVQPFKYDSRRIDVLNRKLSKKKEGSRNRLKAKMMLAKYHERVANQRKDFLHKLSSKIVGENQTICIEDLNVSGMMANHKLSKSIGNASWSEFVNMLSYKSDWYGKSLIKIGKFEPSSKTCFVCNNINDGLLLGDKEWVCSECNTLHDRDINAAQNIKRYGLKTHARNERKSLWSSPIRKDALKQEAYDLVS